MKKKDFVALAWANAGVIRMPSMEGYGKLEGLEGPFQFRSGRVLYYDRMEGRYYDRRSDLYVNHEDVR